MQGGGQRLLSERYLFINSANTILPQIGTFWKSLEDIMDFNGNTNEQGRWIQFYERGGTMAKKVQDAWEAIQLRKEKLITQADTVGLQIDMDKIQNLSMHADNFGQGIISKFSSTINEEFQYMELLILKHRAMQMPVRDSRRISYLYSSNDQSANSIFTALLGYSIKFDSIEFQEAACCHMGRFSPLSCHLNGKLIRAKNQIKFVDEFGYNIKAISGVDGGHRTSFHNDIHYKIAEDLDLVEVKVRGRGPKDTCKNIFSDVINLQEGGNNVETNRILQGIIPDMVIFDNNGRHRENQSFTMYDNMDTLLDVKTLGPGVQYFNGSTTYLQMREDKVDRDYYTSANDLDSRFNGTVEGTIGPIYGKLRNYGRNGRVAGLIFGAFGELSKNVYDLIDFISGRYAQMQARVIDASYSSMADLKAKKTKKLCMEWGLLTHRGWARILRDRLALLIHRDGNEVIINSQEEEILN